MNQDEKQEQKITTEGTEGTEKQSEQKDAKCAKGILVIVDRSMVGGLNFVEALVLEEAVRELRRAMEKHPRTYNSAHEGYAVLMEEVEEMWHEIKNNDKVCGRIECVQVAAVALRMLLEVYTMEVPA